MPLNHVSNRDSIDKRKTEQIIFDIMSKSVPGGILSGYVKDGFPLYFVNDRYLELLTFVKWYCAIYEADGDGSGVF